MNGKLLVDIIISILVVGLILILLILAIRQHLLYKDFRTLRMFVLVVLMDYWSISVIILILNSHFFVIPTEILLFYYRTGTLTLLVGILILNYLFFNPIFSKFTKLLALISYSCYSMLIGFNLYDLFNQQTFFNYYLSPEYLNAEFGLLVSIITTVATLLITLSFVFSAYDMLKLPDYVFSKRTAITMSMTIFLSLIAVTLVSFSGFTSLSFRVVLIGLLFSINILQSYMIYSEINQPFLHFGLGSNPQMMVESHFVGYILSYSGDSGPELASYDRRFAELNDITRLDFETHVVSTIVAMGINQKYPNSLSMTPLTNHPNLFTINISFNMSKSGLKDHRLKNGVPVLFSIILPSLINVNLNNFVEINEKIQKLLSDYKRFEDINKEIELKSVSISLLSELLL